MSQLERWATEANIVRFHGFWKSAPDGNQRAKLEQMIKREEKKLMMLSSSSRPLEQRELKYFNLVDFVSVRP